MRKFKYLLLGLMATTGAAAVDTDMFTTPDSTALSLSRLTADEIRTERLKQGHKIIFVGDGDRASADSVAHMVSMFYVDQYRHFQDPLAPYFLFMSKDAKLAMGIGGCIRMRAWGDFDGSVPVNGFVPYMIPVPRDPDRTRRIGGTPGGTALFFKIIGRSAIGDITGTIQCDFSGPDNVIFKLKKAYVTLADWTIGYAPTTFSDPAAQAPTLDGGGQNGKISHTDLLLRWQHNFTPHWEMATSLEIPKSQVDADGTLTKKLDDYLPDLAIFGQYNWGHSEHVRLSGILRSIPYKNLVTGERKTVLGWGVQASTVFYPVNRLGVYGMVSTGQGYQSYMADMSIGAYDLVADDSTPGRLYAPLAVGLNFGLKYNFTPSVYACAALGRVGYYPDYKVEPSDYRYGLYGAFNVFWDMSPRLQVGAEYLIGSRHNFNGEHNHANRIDVLFQFSF
ncbi:MAG: hypothetical protein K2L73_04940 [Muribaculaceae bacterium]|nr:hypothetical protein [Muribaculaceae bacterium]